MFTPLTETAALVMTGRKQAPSSSGMSRSAMTQKDRISSKIST